MARVSENSQQFKHKSKKMALTNYNLVSRLLLNFEDWKNERNVQIVFKYVQLSVPNRKKGEPQWRYHDIFQAAKFPENTVPFDFLRKIPELFVEL